MDQRLFRSVLNNPISGEFLIRDKKNDNYSIDKPHVDLKIKGDINWDKKCASLSIEFKLFFI